MQPGKPVRVGRIRDTLVMCLPGNPVSALVTGSLFLTPLVRGLLGLHRAIRWRTVQLANGIKANARRTMIRPAHTPSPDVAEIPAWQGSGDLAHLAGTRGLVRLPLQGEVPAGSTVLFTRWP